MKKSDCMEELSHWWLVNFHNPTNYWCHPKVDHSQFLQLMQMMSREDLSVCLSKKILIGGSVKNCAPGGHDLIQPYILFLLVCYTGPCFSLLSHSLQKIYGRRVFCWIHFWSSADRFECWYFTWRKCWSSFLRLTASVLLLMAHQTTTCPSFLGTQDSMIASCSVLTTLT